MAGFEQANKAAEEAAKAAQAMGEVMPDAMSDHEGMDDSNVADRESTPSELDNDTDGLINGHTEVDWSENPKLASEIREKVKKSGYLTSTKELVVGRGTWAQGFDEDGRSYIVICDPVKGKEDWFRVFREDEIGGEMASSYAEQVEDAFEGGGYNKLDKPKGRDKKALQYAKGQIGGDDIFIVEDGDSTYVLDAEGNFYRSK